MLWVVTGFPRTGTSAMMQMLKAGGIDIFFSEARENVMNAQYPDGNFEWLELKLNQMTDTQYLQEQVPDDVAIKLLTQYVRNAPVRPMKIIWMHRDPWEIWASASRIDLRGFKDRYPKDTWEESYTYTTEIMREVMMDRKSVKEIIDIQYNELTTNPLNVVLQLGLPKSAVNAIKVAA